MSAETLVPTTSFRQAGVVASPMFAIDENPNTHARLLAGMVGAFSVLEIDDFPIGTISAGARGKVTLRINAHWHTGDPEDGTFLIYSKDAGLTWQLLSFADNLEVWAGDIDPDSPFDFDITDILGTTPLSDFRIRFQFSNGSAGTPPPIPTEL